MTLFNLQEHGIAVADIRRNLHPAQLYEEAIRYEPSARLTDLGALVAYSGPKTGRSPLDKRIVRQLPSESDIWWGKVNIPLDPKVFSINHERAVDYLNTR